MDSRVTPANDEQGCWRSMIGAPDVTGEEGGAAMRIDLLRRFRNVMNGA